VRLPTAADYRDAIQYPDECFADPDLRDGEVTADALGLPRTLSGNFATVFEIVGPDGRRRAVRCFSRMPDDQPERYAEIAAFLGDVDATWKVGAEFLAEGIRIGGEWFPVQKMEWVDAEPLDRYLATRFHDSDAVLGLARQFAATVADLRGRGAAHGDLQHGNVLVTADGQLKLIDYDGMFVPALRGREGTEVGHRNYQHPARTKAHFGPTVDNFSAWVIYASLLALAIEPSLWERLDGGEEKLLLSREDFSDPDLGLGLRALEVGGDERLAELARIVRANLERPPEAVDELTQLPLGSRHGRAGAKTQPRSAPASVAAPAPVATFAGEDASLVRVAAGCLAGAAVLTLAAAAGALGGFAFGAALALACAGLTLPPLAFARSAPARAKRELERRAQRARATRAATLSEAMPLQQSAAAIAAREQEAGARGGAELAGHQRSLAAEIQQLRQATEQELTVTAERRRELVAAREEALAGALAGKREACYRRELATTTVRGAPIRGIGPDLVGALETHGVHTAADFTGIVGDASNGAAGRRGGEPTGLVLASGRVLRLGGLVEERVQALERWRLQARRLVEARIPTSLSDPERARVSVPFDAALATVEDRERAIRKRGRALIDQARERYGADERDATERARAEQQELVAQRRALDVELGRAERARGDAEAAATAAERALAAADRVTFAAFLRSGLTRAAARRPQPS
jgi:hypothetical protein